MKQRLDLILIAVLLLNIPNNSQANNGDILRTNGVTQIPGGFQVNDRDPYLVFSKTSSDVELNLRKRKLLMHVAVESRQCSGKAISADLFFSIPGFRNPRFNRYNRLTIDLPYGAPLNWEIDLPTKLKIGEDSVIRFDLNQCPDCKYLLGSKLLASQSRLQEHAIDAKARITGAYLGKIQLPENGFVVPSTGWQVNDVVVVEDGYKIVGNDPFLETPVVLLDAENIGGVLLDMNLVNSNKSTQDIQVLYATDINGFGEPASSIVRISQGNGNIKIFVPLTLSHGRTF